MFPFLSCSCLWPIHWSHVSSREWRCSWGSADRQCSKLHLSDLQVYCLLRCGASYIRGLTVYASASVNEVTAKDMGKTNCDRDHSGYGLSQWETTLHCNALSHIGWAHTPNDPWPQPNTSTMQESYASVIWTIISSDNGLSPFGAEPLSEAIMAFCQLDTCDSILHHETFNSFIHQWFWFKYNLIIKQHYCKIARQISRVKIFYVNWK